MIERNSDILYDNCQFDYNSPKKPGIFESIFGTIYDEGQRDNFVQATLPVNKKIFKRILFVTPGIAKENPEGVKETFFRCYCNLLGILIQRSDFLKFKRGKFFELNANESQKVLRNCLNEFETIFGIKLVVGMIDLGHSELSPTLQKEFNDRIMTLFRHPLNMANNQIYYTSEENIRDIDNSCAYQWERALQYIKRNPFRVLQRYLPVSPELPLSEMTCEDNYKLAEFENQKQVTEKLEKIYGKLDEIPLSDSSSEHVADENLKADGCDDDSDEEEYEIINSEDLI